jgi:hypothetical protein
LASLDPVALGLRPALAGLLLRPVGVGALRTAVACLALVGIVVPAALRWQALWLALGALCGWRVLADWPLSDNHAYLLAYFCLAVGVAPFARRPDAALAWNARMLIGLAFLFAVGWKVAAPDFLDGRFFRVTLLADPRLEPTARLAAGVDTDALAEWRAFLTEPPAEGAARVPVEPPRLQALARAAALAALGLEAAVALAFLWPPGRGPSRLRDPLLLGFCATTYAIAPVAGFGWLLLSLGLVQGEGEARWRPWAYLAVFALVLVYRTSLGEAFAGI